LDDLLRRVARRPDACLVHRDCIFSGADLDELRLEWTERLAASGVAPGSVVGVKADWSPDAIALLLALLARGHVAALVPPSAPRDEELLRAAHAAAVWRGDHGHGQLETLSPAGDHPLLRTLREAGGAGFVIFSSGSSGRPKAILHDVERFFRKFDGKGKGLRTLAFLLFDHIAGQDTLFYTLCHGGALVLPENRNPDHVARLVEEHRVEVLPTSPSFLNLFCLAHAQEGRDLSSLKIITYGSEPMPPETLARVNAAFPGVDIIQKYGTSEFGSPRSKSRGRDELWMRLGGDGVEMRILDGILWVRSPSAMLGYLNAPNPFDGDGWYCTGDLVEQDGEWIRILGRESDLINVGGEKVFPQEVEDVIHEIDVIDDVVVRGASHPLTGQVVEAIVHLKAGGEPRNIRKLVRSHCRERLPSYKIPVKVVVTDEPLTSERHKKRRRAPSS